ncbi:hypothetical protein [Oleiharenicola sp. Vm1]|uniref:WD40/YVTN/BNR-like repeat-containing protein n=1 Tax=Oleiharenicola sp. Vm1 TaxID=3398393 RepID=UPI0039F454ED
MSRVFPRRSFAAALCACALSSVLGSAARGAAPAEPYVWRNVAIRGGGYVTGLAFHPREADLLYARTDVGGAYRWDAARRAWLPLNDGIDRANGDLYGVISLALDPRDPARVYLACGAYFSEWARQAAVLRSEDRGATWEIAELPFKLGGNQDGRGTGERLQVDPHDGRHLLLGTNHDGLWRSRDGGREWAQVTGFTPGGVTFVLFDAASGADGHPTPVVYAGAADPAKETLYHSTDGGKSWAPSPASRAACSGITPPRTRTARFSSPAATPSVPTASPRAQCGSSSPPPRAGPRSARRDPPRSRRTPSATPASRSTRGTPARSTSRRSIAGRRATRSSAPPTAARPGRRCSRTRSGISPARPTCRQ